MADFKNSIRLGVELEKASDIQGKLDGIIKGLNNTKINLDINIKNSNVAKQLETLTHLANTFKKSLGDNISLENIDKVINRTVVSMEKLNGELLKTSVKNLDDIITVTKNVATNIGEITKQTTKFQNLNGELKQMGETISTVTKDTQKFNSSMKDIENAQKTLNGLKFNGIVDTNAIDKLKTDLNTIYEESNKENGIKFTDTELTNYLNKVKELENEEKHLKDIQDKNNKELEEQYKLQQQDLKELQKLEQQISSEIQKENSENVKLSNTEYLDDQKNAYTQLNQLLNEEYSIKQKLITAEGEYKGKLEESLISNKLLQTEQNKNIKDNGLTNQEKEIELTNQQIKLQEQLSVVKAKNNDKINSNNLKAELEQEMLLQHQLEFYKQIETFRSNGILNKTDVNNLEKMVQNATKLSQIHNLFGEFQMATMKESSITSLSKQLEDAQIKLNKMKQSFGTKLPSGFVESIESEINKLKTDLTKVDGMNFNGIKNSLNQLNTEMKVTTNSMKEMSSGGFFSNFGDFLGKLGLFYGVQQVVQGTISTIKEGIGTVIEMDTALGNLNKVASMSKDQLLQMRDSAVQMGKELGRSSIEVANAQAEFGRLYKTQEEINDMTKTSLMGANVMDGVTADQVAKSLTTVITSMKMEAKDSMTILDSMNEIQNNYRVSAQDLMEAMAEVGSTAYTSGASLQQVEGYITSIATATGESGSEVGTALRTIMSRVYSIGREGIEAAGLPEKTLEQVGVAVRDESGQFRDFSKILEDLNGRWSDLSKTEQIAVAQKVAGVQRYNQFISLMNNYKMAIDSTNTALNSQGSAEKENQIHMSTAEAKLGVLKASLEELAYKMINSDMVKEGIDALITLVNAISNVDSGTVKLIATFTALGLALKSMSTFTTALKGVESIANLGKGAGVIGGLVGSFSKLGTSIGGTLTALTSLNPIIVGVAVATGVAVASYEEYQDIMNKPTLSTTTDDLSTFGKMINSVTGNVIKSKQELIDANSAYEDFSDDLSDKFKDSVEDASKSFNKLKMSLQFDGEQKIFSDKMSQGIKDQVDDIVEKAKKSILEKKSDVQDTFSKLFTDDDGSIDINESGVLESIGEYENSKFETVQTLNQNIYDTLNKAVEEHRQLTEEDISNIKNWTQQIQALQIQANTGNKFDEEYSSNQGKFEKRLGSMTPEEALSEAKNTYNSIIDINQESEDAGKKTISDASAFIEQWQSEYEKIPDKSSEKALALAKSLDLAREKITQAQNKLNNEVKTRQEQTKKLWDAFYKTNPDKKGKINEVNFTEFSGTDISSNQEFNEVMQWYPQVANITETSMKRIQNANGTWSDVAVTVDEATGKIVSIYDTTTGTVAGYSKQFEDDAEKTYSSLYNAQSKIVALMNDTYSKTNGGSNFKLNGDNNFSIVDDKGVETTIEKMQQVIQLSGGYKVAVANINGTQIKMEFDKDGALQNYEDVLSAINGDKNSKAIVDFDINTEEGKKKLQEIEDKILLSLNGKEITTKITIDGQEADATTDDVIAKLNELKESNPNAKITINGEEIPTIDEAIEKLQNVPPNTNTDVIVNTSEANSKVDETSEKVDELNSQTANPTVQLQTGNSLSLLDRIKNGLSWLSGKIFGATVQISQQGMDYGTQDGSRFTVGHNAKGTDNWRGGLTWINEEGGELVNLPDGTQIIPHDLSKKIIEEEVKNNGSGNLTVNKIDVYQNKIGSSETIDVDTSNTLDKPYETEVDTSGMSDEEKKAYEEKKKAQDEEEKALKDKADKEKQYLEDIGSYWDTNSNSIQQSIKEIELKEAELGDNASYTDKMDLLNQKYQRQLDLLPEAEKVLNTYRNTTVTTEEAQQELGEKIQDATDTLIEQKKAVTDAYNEMRKLAEEEIEKLIKKEKELAEKQIESSNYRFSKSEYNDYKEARIDAIKEEIENLEDLKDSGMDVVTANEAIAQKQQKITDLENEQYNTVKNTQKLYEDIAEQKKETLQSEIDSIQAKIDAMESEREADEQEEELLAKKEAITEAEQELADAQTALAKLQNQKTVQTYQQQEDGTWNFSYEVNQDDLDSAQQEVDDAQSTLDDANEALSDYEANLAYEEELEALQEQQKTLENQINVIDELTESKSQSYQEDLDNLNSYYDDMDKIVDTRFDELKKTYGDNWTELIGSVETSLQSAQSQLDELTKIDLTYKVNTSVGDSSSNSSDLDNSNSSASGNAITDVVQSQFEDVKEYGSKILEQKQSDDSNMLSEQENYQKESLSSSESFLTQQNDLYNTYLELLQNILDWRYGNFVQIASLSTEQIIKLAEIQGEAYNKFVEMYNEMSGEDGDKLSKFDLSSLYDSYNEYKATSLKDYVSDKADLYDMANATLYAGATASSLDISDYLNNNGYSTTGTSSNLGTTNNNSTVNYNIYGDISLPNIKSGTDASSFFDGVVKLANQKSTVKN